MRRHGEVRIAGFALDGRVAVGEVLTSPAILFSVVTLPVNLYRERAGDRKGTPTASGARPPEF